MDNKNLRKHYHRIFKNLNLAEWLAMFRILTFPLLGTLVFVIDRTAFGLTYIILFSTDILDGFAAWIFKNDTDRREILDTWGDNFYFIVGMIGFYHYETEFFLNHIPYILGLSVLYILELILSLKKFGIPSNFHNYSAKLAGFSLFVFLALLFFHDVNSTLFNVTAILCTIDVLDEFIILFLIKEWRTHINGFWEVV